MRARWKTLHPLLVLLPAIAYVALLWSRLTENRLYWEFAGRMTHGLITEGYLEWVHHLEGEAKPLEAAIRLERALAPYTDFPCEYPPGALLLFGAVRLLFDGLQPFSLAFGALVVICVVVAALVVIRLVERQSGDPHAPVFAALAFTVWVPLTGTFLVYRFDSVVVLFVALALLAWDCRREAIAGFCLGLGAAIKLWPAFLVPILGLTRLRKPSSETLSLLPALSLAIGAFVGFCLPHAIMLGLGTSPIDLLSYLNYYGDRPPEVESLQANLLAIGHAMGLTVVSRGFDFGSHNVIANDWRILSHIFSLSFGLSYVWVMLCVLRTDQSRKIEPLATGFIVISLILGSKVFSGEYMIWLLPFALLAAGTRRWGIVAAYAIALMFLKFVYWNWDGVTAIEPFGTLLVFLKNASCLVMAFLMAQAILRISRDPGEPTARLRDCEQQANVRQ